MSTFCLLFHSWFCARILTNSLPFSSIFSCQYSYVNNLACLVLLCARWEYGHIIIDSLRKYSYFFVLFRLLVSPKGTDWILPYIDSQLKITKKKTTVTLEYTIQIVYVSTSKYSFVKNKLDIIKIAVNLFPINFFHDISTEKENIRQTLVDYLAV